MHCFTSALDGGSRPGHFTLQGKRPWYTLDKRLGGPQSRSGCDGEEKNSQTLARLQPHATELSLLKF